MANNEADHIFNTEVRMRLLEENANRTTAAMENISRSLHSLAMIEQSHKETREALGRAFTEINDLEKRLSETERLMPSLVEARRWLVTGLGLIVVTVVGALIALVVKK